jgi:hypothetical protein
VGWGRVRHGRSPRRAGESLSLASCTRHPAPHRPFPLPFGVPAVSAEAGKAAACPRSPHKRPSPVRAETAPRHRRRAPNWRRYVDWNAVTPGVFAQPDTFPGHYLAEYHHRPCGNP